MDHLARRPGHRESQSQLLLADLRQLGERLEAIEALDRFAQPVQQVVARVLREGADQGRASSTRPDAAGRGDVLMVLSS